MLTALLAQDKVDCRLSKHLIITSKFQDILLKISRVQYSWKMTGKRWTVHTQPELRRFRKYLFKLSLMQNFSSLPSSNLLDDFQGELGYSHTLFSRSHSRYLVGKVLLSCQTIFPTFTLHLS